VKSYTGTRYRNTLPDTCDIADRSERATMGAKDYRLDRKGDTVVRVDPPGRIGALYRREHFRAG